MESAPITRYVHWLRYVQGGQAILKSTCLSSVSEEFKEIRGEKQLRAWHLQLFRQRLSEKMCLRQSRKVIWDMIGQYAVPDTVAVESSMSLSLTLSNKCPWPLVPFFQISLKNSELKTTHNTFRDCGVHFSDNLSRNSCIPNLRSIQSSRRANAFDRHSLAYTPWTKFGVF